MSNLSLPRPVTGTVNSINGQTGTVSLSTQDIPEKTNQYFTNARSRSALTLALATHDTGIALSALNAGMSYNSATGVLTLSAESNNTQGNTLVLRTAGGVIYGAGVNATQSNITTSTVQDLTITNSLTLPGTITVSGGLDILGQVITNNIIAGASLSAAGGLIVGDDATIDGTLTVNGPGIVSYGFISSVGNLTTEGALTVNGALQIQGINGLPYVADFALARSGVTNDLPEGLSATNLWFTQPRVIKTPVTGLTLDGSLSGKLTTVDNLSAAFSKIQTTLTQLSGLLLALGKTV